MVETIEVHEPAAAFVRPSADALIRCEGLEKWYGGVQALKGVDFPRRAGGGGRAWSATMAPASRP